MLHAAGIFTYIYPKNGPVLEVNLPAPWSSLGPTLGPIMATGLPTSSHNALVALVGSGHLDHLGSDK